MNNIIGTIEDSSMQVVVEIKGSGPKGDPGEKGEKGESAYEHWLSLGNIGTINDFLLTLKGDKGDKGDTGDIANLDSTHIESALGYTPANATNEHTHTNKSVIDKFTEVAGKPYYNGEEIGGAVPNLTLNELILGGRFKIVYNDVEDSLDIEVI